MRPLREGEIIRFSTMDDFTGEDMELIGTVIGDHEAVREKFPEECAEQRKDFILSELVIVQDSL